MRQSGKVNMNSKELTAIMAEHGLNDPQLAQELGYSKSTINRYRNGKAPIPHYFVISLKNMLQGATKLS